MHKHHQVPQNKPHKYKKPRKLVYPLVFIPALYQLPVGIPNSLPYHLTSARQNTPTIFLLPLTPMRTSAFTQLNLVRPDLSNLRYSRLSFLVPGKEGTLRDYLLLVFKASFLLSESGRREEHVLRTGFIGSPGSKLQELLKTEGRCFKRV